MRRGDDGEPAQTEKSYSALHGWCPPAEREVDQDACRNGEGDEQRNQGEAA